jgi:hypothetical protein
MSRCLNCLLLITSGWGVFLISGGIAEPTHPKETVITTLCEIAIHPGKFNGMRVEFPAQFNKPWIEQVTLTDNACDSVAVVPYLSEKTEGYEALQDALHKDHTGTMDKSITAKWIGKFNWRPRSVPNRTLDVFAVKDLVVLP